MFEGLGSEGCLVVERIGPCCRLGRVLYPPFAETTFGRLL